MPLPLPGDNLKLRKARGAFFTTLAIADHLTGWAISGRRDAKLLDPTCGEAVFLLSAGRQLKSRWRAAASDRREHFKVATPERASARPRVAMMEIMRVEEDLPG